MRLSIFASSVVAAAIVAGCNSPSSPGPEPVGTAAASVTAPTPSASASGAPDGKHRRKRDGGDGHHRGAFSPVARLLHEAEDLDLSDAQRETVEKLQKDLHPPQGARDDRKAMHDELVAGVRAGKIDPAKLDAKNAELDKAVVARREKDLEVLGALHAALQPAQRKALATAMRAKQAAREEHAGEKGDKGPPKGDATGFATRRAERLTKQLELDPAQQKKVEALVAKDRPEAPTPGAMDAAREEAKKRMDALLTAFEGDAFDAKKLDVAPPAAAKGKSRMARELAFLSELLPILRPDQRERLAASMEKRMEHRGPGGPGHHPGFFDD